MINCPSCGSNFEGDLRLGCPSCGARSVGPPLAKPEHELPSYGRAVIVSANGVAMLGVFLTSVIMALIEFKGFPPSFLSIVKAGEVASWRLKWVALPVAILVLWGGLRLIRTIKANPKAFIGLHAARLGFSASVLVTLMIATLIGVTVPQRLRQRQEGIDAGIYAQGYALQLALLEYRELHGTRFAMSTRRDIKRVLCRPPLQPNPSRWLSAEARFAKPGAAPIRLRIMAAFPSPATTCACQARTRFSTRTMISWCMTASLLKSQNCRRRPPATTRLKRHVSARPVPP